MPDHSTPSRRSASPERRILLVDCDQFFVQCARMADPEGAGRERLLLVGGSPEGRGVVTSASYETRRYGVRSGMPMARALRLCPQATVVPVPRELCVDRGRAVRASLERFTPVVEAASIDETYLDLTGTEALYGGEPLSVTAERIREVVHEETQIHVSVGGGTSKLIAKLAVERAKPRGVHVVAPGGEAEFMRGLALREIPGVGPVFEETLRGIGLVTVEDALSRSVGELERRLGERRGRWLARRIRGVDDSPVEPHSPTKSVSREETFPEDLTEDAELEHELLALATRVGTDLREKGLRARTITVKLRDYDFRTRTASRTLPDPLETGRGVYTVALELLAKLRRDRRVGARLLGVGASHFGEGGTQLGLFEGEGVTPETERDRKLARAVDDLRGRFGDGAVRPGGLVGE